MRAAVLAACVVVPAVARAEVSVGASVGAGAQGTSTYSAVELRLDGAWERGHVGLGARGVWDGDEFRRSEWTSGWDAVSLVRDVGIDGRAGETQLAMAAGGLAPAHAGTLVDGYRSTLDDRWRSGVRGVVRSDVVDAGVEIDDVRDPAMIGGSARWLAATPWGVLASVAADPTRELGGVGAGEVGVFRRFESERARVDVGASFVGEVPVAVSGVVFADGVVERGDVRFTARADVRGGSGAVGGDFGPLWRVERLVDVEHRGGGAGAGGALGVAGPAGWIDVGGRRRPDRRSEGVISAGAPMGRRVQAAAWAAVARDEAAGAAEVRVAWANRLFSAVHVARLYRFDDVMAPAGIWSVTAWFGATTR